MAGLLERQAGMNNEGDAVDNTGGPQPGDRGGEGAPPAAGDGDIGDEAPNVTPEEQAQYEAFVRAGMQVIYPDGDEAGQVRKDVMARLQESSDPIQNLANVTVWLVTMVESSAEQSGQQLDDAVVMHGGIALLEELAEVATAAKIHDFNEQDVEAATYSALDLYKQVGLESGRLDPNALAQEFDNIVAADRAGQLPGVDGSRQEAPVEEEA